MQPLDASRHTAFQRRARQVLGLMVLLGAWPVQAWAQSPANPGPPAQASARPIRSKVAGRANVHFPDCGGWAPYDPNAIRRPPAWFRYVPVELRARFEPLIDLRSGRFAKIGFR